MTLSFQAKGYRLGLVVLVSLTYVMLACYPELMMPIGIGLPDGRWFIDIYALLASSDAFAIGLDPYLPNPLDWLRVPHWYSDWWFYLDDFGWDRSDAPWLGIVIGAGYLVAALSVIRPRNITEMVVGWLTVSAPVAMLGFNRANPDLLIFSAFVVVGWLLTSQSRPLWLFAGPLIACLAGLKFYPLAGAFALAFAPRVRKEVWVSLILMLVLVCLLALGLYDDVQRVAPLLDTPAGFYVFGGASGFILAGFSHPNASILTVGLGCSVAIGWRIWTPTLPKSMQDREVVAFVLGAATLIGCFVVGVGYSYRLVFVVLLLPLLGSLRVMQCSSGVRWLVRIGLIGILFLGWFDGLVCLGSYLFSDKVDRDVAVRIWHGAFVITAVVGWVWVSAMMGLLIALSRNTIARLFSRDGVSPPSRGTGAI